MNIKNFLILLLFLVAIVGIIAPINAVDSANSNKIKIKWDANGGKIGNKKTVTTTINKGSKIGSLQKATRTDNKLKGWYTKKTGGTKINKDTKSTSSVTYYAQWESTSKKNDKTKAEKELKAIKKKIVGTWKYKKGDDSGELTFKSDGSFTWHYLYSDLGEQVEEKRSGKYSVNYYSSSKKTHISATGKTTSRDYLYDGWSPWTDSKNTGRLFEYIIKNGKENILDGVGNAYYQKS